MLSVTEILGNASYCKSGELRINQQYVTLRKPAWLIALKVLGVTAMVAVAYAIALPTLEQWLKPWEASVGIAGVILIYTGLAFFLRPEPNTDNMGPMGGLINDPFQTADDVNRQLFKLHCCLGPGRFISETLLDICVYVGIAGGEEVVELSVDDDQAASLEFGPGEAQLSDASQMRARYAVASEDQLEIVDFASESALAPDRFSRRR